MNPTVETLLLRRVLRRLERKRNENLDEAGRLDDESLAYHVRQAYAEAFGEALNDLRAEMGMEESDD